ncbi:MAG: hypothetical protein KAH95_04965, partial [Spirochaetales bacterium]|nr:hypothetical protein [Spirochaetales bacterium]
MMDSKSDKEYLITVKTEYKLLEKKFLKTREKLIKWNKRVTLAEEKGKSKLQSEAEAQAEIVKNEIKYLTEQLVGLKVEVERTLETTKKSPQQQLSI